MIKYDSKSVAIGFCSKWSLSCRICMCHLWNKFNYL